MLEGMYSAAAGMAAQQQRLDAIANDLANTSTTGYKRERVDFRDLVYVADDLSGAARSGTGAAVSEAGRAFEQGAMQQTGSPLDLAIEGDGFFRVRRPDGTIALTRSGNFSLDANGRMTTTQGDLLDPPITIPRGAAADRVEIGADGSVRADGRAVGRIALVSVRATAQLQSIGDSLFLPTAASGPVTAGAAGQVRQGMLEASNVDVGQAMVAMIDAQRTFQLTSQAIRMSDQLLEIANGVKR